MKVNLYLPFYSKFIFSFFLLIFLKGTGLFAQADQPIFSDDFNRNALGSFWVADASWSIKNGTAYSFIDAIDEKLITATAYSQPSYIIETAAKGFTKNYSREFRITFGQADLSKSALYQVRYTAYGGARLTLSKSVDNIFNPQVLDEVPVLPELGVTQWYTFKIARYKSGLIQVYINTGAGYTKIPVLEAIDLSYAALGHTGWHVGTEAFAEEFSVDYISAVKPGIEKPAVKEKPAEDDLITQVSVKTGKPYTVSKLDVGAKQLIDRSYTITSAPGYLKGASFIQSANGDKSITADSILSFFVTKDVIVYIAYDPRAGKIPDWLTKWTKTGDKIGVSDPNVSYLEIYHRVIRNEERFSPVILGGNLASPAAGAETNYLVAAIEWPGYQQLQAEDAFLLGAVVANNHANYTGTGFVDFIHPSNDYIEWAIKINVPGTYNLGFLFAHAGLTDRSLLITDNGINVGTVTFSRVSSSWSSWAFLQGPSIFIAPGIHKIRVTATGTSGPNMDMLSLVYQDNYYPAPNANNLARSMVPGTSPARLKAYPNPFLQTTNISYTVKEKAQVSLSIYTLQGQRVQLLENRVREAGNYNLSFNGSNLAKGIYLYRLQIGTEVQTGKLVKQ